MKKKNKTKDKMGKYQITLYVLAPEFCVNCAETILNSVTDLLESIGFSVLQAQFLRVKESVTFKREG